MSNLFSFFGLNEMARSAGSFGKIMRAALEKARMHGGDFTVKQFCAWLIEAGAENAQPTSVKTRLNKLIAGDGERPSAFKPLVATNKGRTGPGDPARLKYVFDGPAGASAKSDLNRPKDDEDDDIPFEDDDDTAASAPKAKDAGWPKWLPKPDPDGSYDQEKMAQLQDAGYGADQNQLWADIAQAENNIAVHDLVKKAGVPPQLRMAVVRVAQEVFKNLDKPWDAKSKPLSQARNWVDDDDSGGAFSEPEDETELGDDDFEDEEDTDPGIPTMEPDEEEPEATQAGAANFLKPAAPAPVTPPKPPAAQPPPAPAKKSSVSKFFRR